MQPDFWLHSEYEGTNRKTVATFTRSDPPLCKAGRVIWEELLKEQLEPLRERVASLPAVIAWRELAESAGDMEEEIEEQSIALEQARLDRKKAVTGANLAGGERAAAIAKADREILDLETKIKATQEGKASFSKDVKAAAEAAEKSVLALASSSGIAETLRRILKERVEAEASKLRQAIAPGLDMFASLSEADHVRGTKGNSAIESGLLAMLN